MKFNGKLKNSYDRYWDSVVVIAYKNIKASWQSEKHSFFATNSLHWVTKYCDGVESMIGNLSRQLPFVTDEDYAREYLEQTRAAAIGDLKKFKHRFKDVKIISRIDSALDKLHSVVAQTQEVAAKNVEEELTIFSTSGMVLTEAGPIMQNPFSRDCDPEWEAMMAEFDEPLPKYSSDVEMGTTVPSFPALNEEDLNEMMGSTSSMTY